MPRTELTRRPRRRRLYYGLVVVAVALVVLLVLAATGHLGPTPSGAHTAVAFGTPVRYSQIAGPAESARNSASGGPWTARGIIGVGSSSSYTGAGGVVAGCTAVSGGTGFVTLLATPSNATAGSLAFWIEYSTNPSGELLLTYLTDTTGSVIATNWGVYQGSCGGSYTTQGAVPGTVVDSSTVVASANGAGGGTYLANNPGATRLVGLIGSGWLVLYTPCSFGSSGGGSGNEWADGFNATSGNALGTPVTIPVTC